MGKVLEQYKSYVGWENLFDVALIGVISYALNFTLQGFIGGVLFLHFAGFLIDYYNLDGDENNPMKQKAMDFGADN